MNPKVVRRAEKILGDPKRIIAQQHLPGNPDRIKRTIQRIISLPEQTAKALLEQVMLDFADRHRDIVAIFKRHSEAVAEYLPPDIELGETKQDLIGAYFTKEYSIESAALFNPSIIPHPDQSGRKPCELRFILSLRATGEGDRKSVV